MGVRTQDLDVHIEALVLHGVSAHDRVAVACALGDELLRLLRAHGISPALARGGYVERIDAGAFSLSPAARAPAVGAQIARSAHRGLMR